MDMRLLLQSSYGVMGCCNIHHCGNAALRSGRLGLLSISCSKIWVWILQQTHSSKRGRPQTVHEYFHWKFNPLKGIFKPVGIGPELEQAENSKKSFIRIVGSNQPTMVTLECRRAWIYWRELGVDVIDFLKNSYI